MVVLYTAELSMGSSSCKVLHSRQHLHSRPPPDPAGYAGRAAAAPGPASLPGGRNGGGSSAGRSGAGWPWRSHRPQTNRKGCTPSAERRRRTNCSPPRGRRHARRALRRPLAISVRVEGFPADQHPDESPSPSPHRTLCEGGQRAEQAQNQRKKRNPEHLDTLVPQNLSAPPARGPTGVAHACPHAFYRPGRPAR